MEGHYGFLEASLHSKPYIALIGPAGDNHDISNREKDDMSRDPPPRVPKAPTLALYSHFWSFWSKPSGRFGQAVRTK